MKNLSLPDALKVITFAACCMGATHTFAAKYYKWVDDNGVTHYSAQPPEAGKGELIKVKSGASSDKDAALKKLEERRAKLQQDAESRANPKTAPEDEVAKKNAEMTQKNCEIHRNNLKVIKENARVRMFDENGESRVVPEEERQAKMKKAQDFIAKHCN